MREPDFSRLDTLAHQVGGVTEMPGGASTRRYFRVEIGSKTAVAMFVPEGAKPEEIAKDAPPNVLGNVLGNVSGTVSGNASGTVSSSATPWPFLEVRELLAASGVDVPTVYAEDQEHGWLLIEDLGDDTLANFLLRSESSRQRLYQRAVVDLARAQKALKKLPKDSIIKGRAFDEDLLRWEIDHFREWGLEARGHVLSAEDRATFDAIAGRLAHRIAGWPRGFVHRDYQSRNLMVRQDPESLCWIDFQDALLGPRVYDLVALLNDSYQTFDRAFVEARLSDYVDAAGLPKSELAVVTTEFDYVTVQRKLKDAGRFVFIDRKKSNPGFLRFVVPTIQKVGAALERLSAKDDDMSTLRTLLKRALPAEMA